MGDGKRSRQLPPKPEEPLQTDCCGMGCTPCVFDRYEEEVRLWEKECDRIRIGDVNPDKDVTDSASEPVLSDSEYNLFTIVSVTQESRDSFIFRFQLPATKSLGLCVGQHLILRCIAGNKVVTRQYTPVSDVNTLGYFDLLLKIYPDGRMSQHLNKLKIGDRVEFRGPCGSFSYTPNKWHTVFMLAAGTGIAPMAQVIQQVVTNEEDDTRVSLMYSCKTYGDLLLKVKLDEWSAYWNVSIVYILTQDDPHRVDSVKRYGEEIHHGRLGPDLLSQVLPKLPQNHQVLVCGTTSFEKDMISYLENKGFSAENYHKF